MLGVETEFSWVLQTGWVYQVFIKLFFSRSLYFHSVETQNVLAFSKEEIFFIKSPNVLKRDCFGMELLVL